MLAQLAKNCFLSFSLLFFAMDSSLIDLSSMIFLSSLVFLFLTKIANGEFAFFFNGRSGLASFCAGSGIICLYRVAKLMVEIYK